jgi:outer membrane lipoprotein SlyB
LVDLTRAQAELDREQSMKDIQRKVGPTTTLREAVGVFHDPDSLQEAIDELLGSGFDRRELSLLASERAVEEKLGHRYRKVAELEDDPRVPRTAYVSTESIGDAEGGLIGGLMYLGAVVAGGAMVASGGTLAGAFLAAAMAGGAGGLFGSALAKLIDYHHADYLQGQLDKGGLLLWVRTRDREHEQRAKRILERHSGEDAHVHELSAETYLAASPQAGDLERALLDPTAVFKFPEEVLQRTDLSHGQKAAILRRWAYDARELEVAEDEGMRDGEPDLLDRVLRALDELKAPSIAR